MSLKTKGILCVIGTTVMSTCQAWSYSILTMLLATYIKFSGFTAVQVMVIISIGMFTGFFGNVLLGYVHEKVNPKIFCAIGSVNVLLLYLSMATTKNLWVIYACAFFWGINNVLCSAQTHFVLVSKWFKTGTGTLMSSAAAIRKLIQIFANPLIAAAVIKYGFKNTFIGIGILFSGVILLSSIFLISKAPANPEDQVELKFKEKAKNDKPVKFKKDEIPDIAMSALRMLKLPVVLLALIVPAFITLPQVIFTSNMSLIYKGMGAELMKIAYLSSIAGIASLFINPLYGIISDTIGSKKAMYIYCAIGAIVFCIFPFLRGFGGALVLALTYNVTAINAYYPGTVLPSLVGKKNLSYMIGWSTASNSLASTVAPVLAAALFTANGNYSLAMVIGGIGFIIAMFMTMFAVSKRTKDRILKADEEYRKTLVV